MAFWDRLFGKKKNKSEVIAVNAQAEREQEEADLIAAGILSEKPNTKKEETEAKTQVNVPETKKSGDEAKETTITKAKAATSPKKEKADKKQETTKEGTVAIQSIEKNADKKTDDSPTEKTVEEIDASFAEAANEISEEIAKAEAKSGRALARFVIKKAKDGRFVFNLYAPNRIIVATSQIYSSSTSAVNGTRSIAVNAPKAPIEDTTLKTVIPVGFPKWEIYLDKAGRYRFRLFAPNGSCIVHSQGYTTKASCKNGIASIIKNAPEAIIDKSYLKKDEK